MLTSKTTRQLVLNKGAQKYIFRYDVGAEDLLLESLVDQANDNNVDFDWFDAAVLSFKLARTLIDQADEIIKKDSPVLGGSVNS